MVNFGIGPPSSGLRTAVTPDTCIIQDTNDSAYFNSARHGQFQEKEKNAEYLIECFPTEKQFSTKNKIFAINCSLLVLPVQS